MEEVEEKLDLVEESVRRLENLEVEEKKFLEYQGVKHTLQEAVEACIDVAGYIIAEEGFGRQDDYADYFKELEERDIIDENLSSELQDMARFRNLVVHRYSEIEPEQLQEIIDQDLSDLLDFVEAVEKYYQKN
jgi:uncharacterized protein YutE (UPF0331/DUF86 family)